MHEYNSHAKAWHHTNGRKNTQKRKSVFIKKQTMAQAAKAGPVPNIFKDIRLFGRVVQDQIRQGWCNSLDICRQFKTKTTFKKL